MVLFFLARERIKLKRTPNLAALTNESNFQRILPIIYTLLVDNMRNMCMPGGTEIVERIVYKAHLQNTDIKQ